MQTKLPTRNLLVFVIAAAAHSLACSHGAADLCLALPVYICLMGFIIHGLSSGQVTLQSVRRDVTAISIAQCGQLSKLQWHSKKQGLLPFLCVTGNSGSSQNSHPNSNQAGGDPWLATHGFQAV